MPANCRKSLTDFCNIDSKAKLILTTKPIKLIIIVNKRKEKKLNSIDNNENDNNDNNKNNNSNNNNNNRNNNSNSNYGNNTGDNHNGQNKSNQLKLKLHQ